MLTINAVDVTVDYAHATVLFSLLVMYFEPAALKLGQTRFGVIAVALVVVGLLLNIYGYRLRRRGL